MSHLPVRSLNREPNVVPMIDVLLVLLIIFMLAVEVQRRAVDIQLPQPATSPGDVPSIVLSVDPGPTYTLNGVRILPQSLGAELARVFQNRPKVILVRGAPTVRYQDVITAFDVARGAGVRVTGIVPASVERRTVDGRRDKWGQTPFRRDKWGQTPFRKTNGSDTFWRPF
jgi:biopolymer transport protein ExbD